MPGNLETEAGRAARLQALARAQETYEAVLVAKPRLGLEEALQLVDGLLAAATAAEEPEGGPQVTASSSSSSSREPQCRGDRRQAAQPNARRGKAAAARNLGRGRGTSSANGGGSGGGSSGAAADGKAPTSSSSSTPSAADGSAQPSTTGSGNACESASSSSGTTAAMALGGGASLHLNPVRVLRVKLLVEQAAAAALAESDEPACRERVLGLLCSAQAEAAAALWANPSMMFHGLASCLLGLTGGCSGPAVDAGLDAWQATLAVEYWVAPSGGPQPERTLPHCLEEVSSRQHPRLAWPLDLPPGVGVTTARPSKTVHAVFQLVRQYERGFWRMADSLRQHGQQQVLEAVLAAGQAGPSSAARCAWRGRLAYIPAQPLRPKVRWCISWDRRRRIQHHMSTTSATTACCSALVCSPGCGMRCVANWPDASS